MPITTTPDRLVVVPRRHVLYQKETKEPGEAFTVTGAQNIAMIGVQPNPSKYAVIEVYCGEEKTVFTSDGSEWKEVITAEDELEAEENREEAQSGKEDKKAKK